MAKVDILNYISESNILRSTYDTDTNELDITDVPQNLNSVITLGQGGGGAEVEELNVTANGTYTAPEGKAYSPVNVNVESPFKLLDTITVSEDVRAVNVDISSYTSLYDFILLYEDVTLSAADWLYYVRNGSTPDGGTYSNGQHATHQGTALWKNKAPGNAIYYGIISSNTSIGYSGYTSVNNLYIYAYTASKRIKAGSVFKIYGGNYADL